jgi:uncharacterized protein YigA (DUF484 family)
MRSLEPVFQWLMDTAAETKALQADIHDVLLDMLEAEKQQTDFLKVIAAALEKDP